MSNASDAMSDAERAGNGSPQDRFIERLAERVGAQSGARAVFGEPVERNGTTVIPVARVRWGFGGGMGTGKDERGEAGSGSGGGGGVMAAPAGYIEISNGQTRFVQYTDPAGMWPLVVAGAFASWMILRGLRALIR